MSAETTIYKDLTPAQLIEQALSRGEGQLADSGALVVTTGKRTGRSPGDRYIVQEPSTSDSIDWTSVNRPFESAKFDALWDRVQDYLAEHDSFVSNLHVGAQDDHYIPVVVNTQTHGKVFLAAICLYVLASTIPKPRKSGPSSTALALFASQSVTALTLTAASLSILPSAKYC
jgi:ATP-dependent phosphoenolpyruvate carboxykinase